MANYRNIHMTFWTDGKVVDDFSPEDKYVYLWCLTNPHTNLCGCYEVSIKQIANELGYDSYAVERVLKRLDTSHEVVRYNAPTKELLILNWFRYNWSQSEKLDKPLLAEIQKIKHEPFRNYLAGWYNTRGSIQGLYDPAVTSTPKKAVIRHKHGEYGYVQLSDAEYEKLLKDIGEPELLRCIAYVDESAKATGNKNKWKDWNIVIRKCNRQGWGIENASAKTRGQSKSEAAMGDLQALHQMFSEEEGA